MVGVGDVRSVNVRRQVNKSGSTRGGIRDVIGPSKLRKSGTHTLFGSVGNKPPELENEAAKKGLGSLVTNTSFSCPPLSI